MLKIFYFTWLSCKVFDHKKICLRNFTLLYFIFRLLFRLYHTLRLLFYYNRTLISLHFTLNFTSHFLSKVRVVKWVVLIHFFRFLLMRQLYTEIYPKIMKYYKITLRRLYMVDNGVGSAIFRWRWNMKPNKKRIIGEILKINQNVII